MFVWRLSVACFAPGQITTRLNDLQSPRLRWIKDFGAHCAIFLRLDWKTRPMTFLEGVFARTDRMFEMAIAMNRDLSAHVPGSIHAAQELRGAVNRCLFCTDAKQCAKLVKTEVHLASAPEYCRNREFLKRLPTL